MDINEMFQEEPQPQDMLDANVQADLFAYLASTGVLPEDLAGDFNERAKYAEYLKNKN